MNSISCEHPRSMMSKRWFGVGSVWLGIAVGCSSCVRHGAQLARARVESLRARVCNRGTNPVADGALVRFELVGSDGGAGPQLCEARTTQILPVGECIEVECSGTLPSDMGRSVRVRVDPDSAIADCHRNNNVGFVPIGTCPG
jgi:hypothetical protein